MKPIDREMRISVDLDKENGRTPRPGKENTSRIVIRQTNEVGFAALEAYLKGQCDFSNEILETMNFLDHLFHESPRIKYVRPLLTSSHGIETDRFAGTLRSSALSSLVVKSASPWAAAPKR